MSAKFARESFRGTTPGRDVEAEAAAVPLHRGVIAPSLLCGCALCGVAWKRSDAPRLDREGVSGRVVSPGFLCDCAVCGCFPFRAGFASLRRPVDEEEECLRRRSVRWKLKAPGAMGSLWDAFGQSGARDPGGCGFQRVIGSVFSKDRVYDEEERHRCILHFPSMREFFTHEEVEQALVQLGWRPLTKRGGWRRYFKIEEPTLPYGLPTIAKLPGRSFVDSPKPILLDFVKTVNRRENRNIFCCWEHRGELLVSAGDRTILN